MEQLTQAELERELVRVRKEYDRVVEEIASRMESYAREVRRDGIRYAGVDGAAQVMGAISNLQTNLRLDMLMRRAAELQTLNALLDRIDP